MSEAAQDGAALVARSLEELATEHPYLEGRVAPRRILAVDGARIMHLAFDTDQVLREHSAPVPILIQAIAGSVTVEAAEQATRLEPGGIIHLAARLPHAVTAHGQARILVVFLADAAARAGRDRGLPLIEEPLKESPA